MEFSLTLRIMSFTKNKLIKSIIILFLCLQEPETDSHFGQNHKNSPDIKGTTFMSKLAVS